MLTLANSRVCHQFIGLWRRERNCIGRMKENH